MADSQKVVGEVLVAWEKYTATGPDELNLKAGDVVELLDTNDPQSSPKRQKLDPDLDTIGSQTLDNSAAKHKLSVKPKRTHKSSRHSPTRLNVHARWLVREVSGNRRQGWVPCRLLQTIDDPTLGSSGLPGDAVFRRQAVVKELVETEQEFVKDLDYFVSHYLFGSQAKKVPKVVRDNFEGIFTNLKELAEFHRGVLMEGVKYYQNEPHLLGKAFLRLERDFDKHANYCQDEPLAQQILESSEEARIYFDALTKKLRDDKSISEHLKLPIQRINDYQLLLKELVRYSTCLNEDTTNLHKALELMLSVPSRAEDDKFTQSIEGYPGSIHKLGRLIAHDWFSIVLREAEKKERYLFLFKGRILICKVRRISDDRSVFQLKDTIRLPLVEVKDHPDDNFTFELVEKTAGHSIILTAHRDQTKELWLNEIREFAKDFGDKDFLSPPGDEAKSPEKEPEKPEESKKNPQIEVTSPEPKKQDKLQEELKQKLESRKEVNSVIEEKTENKEKVLETKTVEVSSSKEEKPIIEEPKFETVETKTSNPEPESEKSENLDPKRSNPGIETKKPELEPEKLKEVTEKVELKNTDKDLDTTGEEPRVTEPSPKPKKPKKEPSVKRPITPQPPEEDDHHLKRIKAVEPLVHLNNPRILEEVLPYKPKPYVEPQGSALQKLYTVDSVPLGETVVAADYSVAFEVNVEIGDTDMSRRYTSARGETTVLKSQTIISSETSIEGGGISENTVEQKSARSEIKETSASRVESSSEKRSVQSEEKVTAKKEVKEESVKKESVKKETVKKESHQEAHSEEHHQKTATEKLVEMEDEHFDENKPRFIKTIRGANIEPGEITTFEVSLNAQPDTFAWLKDNKPVNGNGEMSGRIQMTHCDAKKEYKLVIKQTILEDSGLYTAIASNDKGKTSCSAQLIVHELTTEERAERMTTDKPEFLVSLKDTELLEDTYLRFMVKVYGEPNPDITFYKDGTKIPENVERFQVIREQSHKGFYELVIPDVKHKDAGVYKCVATNKFGEASSEATVTVTDSKKVFDDMPEGEILPPGEKPVFQWKKDGLPFEPEERFKVLMGDDEDSLALVFQHVRPEDVGLYTCVAQTSRGHISCSAELTVHGTVNQLFREPEKPKLIIEKREPIVVNVGASAMMELQIKGYPKPQVKLTHDGKAVEAGSKYKILYEDEETLSVVIKNVQSEDAGKYTVVAENELGSDIGEMTVIVKEPSKMKTKLEDVSIHADEVLKMSVEVGGIPKPTVKFYKDGKELKQSERIKYVEEGEKYSLVIEKTNLKDSGSYSVVATNELAQVSEFNTLKVFSKPKLLEKLGKDKIVSQGDNFQMKVKVEAEPISEVTWYKDEEELTSGDHYLIKKEGDSYILKISGAVTTDAAKYKVKAVNIHGSAEDEVRVDVKKMPKITKELQNMTVTENDTNVTFDVKLEAFPKPQVKWYLDEMEITETKTEFTRIESDDGVQLVIKEVNSDLRGQYTCKLSNECGEVETSAKLTVNCAPRIIRKLNDTTVEEGSTLHLEVEVDACPAPTVKWVRNGREINADARIKITRDTKRYENYNLAVSLIKYEEQGEYEVFITNSLGTVSCKSFVTVHKVGFSDANEETCEEPKKISVTEVEEEPQKAPEEEEPEKPKQSKLTIKKHDKPIVEEPLTPNLENTENKNVTDEFLFKKRSSVQIEEVEAAQKINETEMEPKKPKRGSISTKESIEVIEQQHTEPKTIEETDKEHRELKRGISATKENIEIVEEPDSRKAKINDLLQEKKLQKALRHHSVSIEEIEPQTIKRKTSLRRESIVLIDEITALKQKAETTLDNNKQKGILATQESIESITEDTRAQKIEESSLEHRKPKRGSLAQTGSIEIVERTKPQQIDDSFTEDKKPKKGTMSQKESIEIIEETKPQKIDETSKKPKRGSMSQKESIELIEETKAHKIDESFVEHTKSKRGSLAHKESIEITEENKPQKMDETTIEHKKPKRGSMAQKESMELIENQELTDTDIKRTKETEVDIKPEQKKGILSSQESIEHVSEISKPQKPDESTLEPKIPKRGSLAHKESLEHVEKAPEALPSLLDTNMKDGSRPESLDITYIVRGTSNPPPKAKWTLNGEEIVPDKDLRVSVSENGEEFKLEITNLKLKDAGEYQCAIFNPLGVVTQRAVLDVTPEQELRRPKIKQGLEDQTIIKKHSVTHKVVIIGEPTPEITWYFNGKKITEKQMEKEKMIVETEEHEIEETLKECSYSLTIPRCERSNQGTFSMKAKNKWGECESSAELTVILRPEIEGPTDVSVVPGEATEFEVIIQSNPAPEVTWSLGDKIIVPTEFIEIIEDAENEKYKLIFKNVLLSDGGYYKVTAKNHLGETTSEARLKTIKDAEPSTEVPKFITGLFESQVQDGGDHTASVRAYGLPKPTIKWFRNGEPLVEDENHKIETHTDLHVNSTLTILNYNEADVGLYKATATNVVGEAETSCRISMLQTPPTFGKRLDRSHDANEGEPLELKAKINGSPKPIVAWFKDGEPIKDDRVKTTVLPDGTVKLNIDNVTPEDSGAYKLVVKNVNGDTSCLCAVAVTPTPKRPKFTKCFKDTKLPLGEKLRLQAQISAYPPPEIKWLKDGLPIRATSNIHMEKHPDGTIALVIDCAKPENAGNYQVVISNKLGELTGDAKVNIEKKPTKPEFVVKLKPEIVVEGFPVRLEVKAEGFPAPTIKWFRQNAEVISDNQHIKIVELADGTSALLLDGADQLRDALTYKAEATNDAGTSETVAPLSVIPAVNEDEPESKPIFLASLKDCLTDEGLPFILEAPFSGNPVPSAKWTKDGVPIEPSDRVLMSCDGRRVGLKIDHALPSDAGVYTCSIENVHGKDCKEAKGIVHKVYMPPNFTQRFTDLQQLPSRDAKFLCRVTGVPQPDVTWTKDGEPIRESEKYRIKRDGDTCCLVIINAQPEDAGVFRAAATNKEGQDVCTASLEVVPEIKAAQKIEPPVFLKRIGDTELYKGMTAKFTACASGIPEPEAEWYHNDQKIFPSTRIRMETDRAGLLRLSLENVDIDDIGKYSCKISNEHGSDICHANLKFDDTDAKKRPVSDQYIEYDKYKRTGAPMPLSEPPIISQMTDRHCTLSWRPSIPTGPRSPVTYQLEMCELPTGDWFTVRSGIRSCTCGVRNLEPFRDYKFRVRVENKYGISDPSPYAVTHRQKLEPEPPKYTPYLPSGIDFRPETSPYFPKDFDIERPPHDNMAQAPRFLRQEHDTQYGVKDQSSNLFWYVYGYPKPRMTYYFNDELVDSGGRFDSSYTRNGQATLFINKMLDRDVGWYEAVARNEHGEARQRVRLEIAEFPTFIRRPEIQYVMMRDRARFEARIVGVPYPEIKWYKDWKPLASSSRIKITFIEPDTTVLTITDIILKDEGLYSCSARNVAGSTSASAMLHVDENDIEYNFHTYSRYAPIQCKRRLYTDLYDIGDELGRGTQGITYHAVERLNGRNYAAKIMHGRSELKNYMYNELEMMNSLRHRKLISLHDSYEMDDTVAIIMELASGGELVHDYLLKSEYYTERDIAGFMRQMLDGLHYMHEKGYGHMGLTLGDLLLSHPGGDDLKIGDFGLTRKINMGHLYTLNFGMPEYVSPECASGQGVNLAHDMWSVGIITYILLSGRSPFRGANDMETLTNIRSGKWIFEDEWWTNISVEAKDFITRLLVYKQEDRMDVHTALRHSWLERADKMYQDEYRISSRYLSDYWRLYREWYDNASCRRWYRRRPLEGAFTHPSKMVYPPGESYTPRSSPIREKTPRVPKTWEDQLPSRSPLNYEIGMIKSESHYQNGPDTYLLQLRDVDFPVRLREYMKVAANRGPGCPYIVSDENGYDWRTPVIRERRRFTDVMDEEIDDERKARINRYGTDENSYSIRRLKNELGSRLDSYVEAEAYIESKQDGRLPFFREKPQTVAMQEGKDLELSCLAVGEPTPIVQWFKNDSIIAESHRIQITTDADGRSHFKLSPALSFDQGMYKVAARNKVGQTIARCRIVLGMVPDEPDSPEASQVSDTEILLTWKQPKLDGNSPVLCYSLEYKVSDGMDWLKKADNIDHEFYLIGGLTANTGYIFRLAARNAIGWSDAGVPCSSIMTKAEGAEKVQLGKAMLHLQQITDSGIPVNIESKIYPNYATESNPIEWQDGNLESEYNIISEISRGRFSCVLKAIEKKTDAVVVIKLLDLNEERRSDVDGEFAALRSLRHERIAGLIAAYRKPDSAAFILEKLQGADILTYLSSRHEYSEQTVVSIVSQVLDGLAYLHWRGLCHLDLQPDNIVMCGVRSVEIKLVDLGSAHRVTKLGNKVPIVGHPDYISPEVLSEEQAIPQTDIWSVGVLTYVMLSGRLPFRGNDLNETRQNILFVRYRFEHLFNEVSPEATRFLMLLFKRHPYKRPTPEECHENRWLLVTDFMIKKRERAVFLGNRLKEYSDEYHNEKSHEGDKLASKLGGKFMRSHSIQDELSTAP